MSLKIIELQYFALNLKKCEYSLIRNGGTREGVGAVAPPFALNCLSTVGTFITSMFLSFLAS